MDTKKDMCLREIGLPGHNLVVILDSRVNISGRDLFNHLMRKRISTSKIYKFYIQAYKHMWKMDVVTFICYSSCISLQEVGAKRKVSIYDPYLTAIS